MASCISYERRPEEEQFTRLMLYLGNPCLKLMRAIFEKHVRSTSAGNIIDFLKINKTHILGTTHGRNNKEKYFPSDGTDTDVTKWDIVMLYHMTKRYCPVNYPSLGQHLDDVKEIRNKLCHQGTSRVSDSDYQRYNKQIQEFIQTALEYLNDNGLQDNVLQNIDQIEKPLDTAVYYLLSGVHRVYTDQGEKIESLKEEVQENTRKVEENTRAVKAFSESVAVMQKLFTSLTPTEQSQMPPPPGVSFKLAMQGCTDEQEEEASRNVVDSTNNQTSKQGAGDKPDDQLGSAIQESLERMSHAQNTFAEKGCVTFYVKFDKFADFLEFLDELLSGKITGYFQPVQKALRKMLKVPSLELEATMNSEQLAYCSDYIVSALKIVAGKKEIEIQDKMTALNKEQEQAKEAAASLENSITDLQLQLRKVKVDPVSCDYQTNANGFEAAADESLLAASTKLEIELRKKREELKSKQDEIEKAKEFIDPLKKTFQEIERRLVI